MARPTKRTPEVVKIIEEAIENGAADYVAAQAAGIAPSTFRLWLQDEAFSASVAGARARARMKAEALVFGGNPLAWLTKGPGRPRPSEDPEMAGWTDASKVELTGKDGGPVSVDVGSARELLMAGLERLKPKPDDDGAA